MKLKSSWPRIHRKMLEIHEDLLLTREGLKVRDEAITLAGEVLGHWAVNGFRTRYLFQDRGGNLTDEAARVKEYLGGGGGNQSTPWQRLFSPRANAADDVGIVSEKQALLDRATLELELARADLANHDRVQELDHVTKVVLPDIDALYRDNNKRLDEARRKFEQAQTVDQQRSVYEELKNHYLPQIEREYNHGQGEVSRVRQQIHQFRDYVQHVTIQQIEQARQVVDEAYEKFKSLMSSASFRPRRSSPGPSAGPPSTSAAAWSGWAGRRSPVLESGYKGLVESRSFDELLQRLDAGAAGLETNLSQMELKAEKRDRSGACRAGSQGGQAHAPPRNSSTLSSRRSKRSWCPSDRWHSKRSARLNRRSAMRRTVRSSRERPTGNWPALSRRRRGP